METDSVAKLTQRSKIQGERGQQVRHTREIKAQELGTGGSRFIGYVPIQIINLSLEEVKLSEYMYA
jgi:hypothetical protein